MLTFWKTPVRLAGGLILAAALAVAQAAVARPGTINYTEGQVTLDQQSIAPKSLGQAEVDPNHVLQTDQGKAEVLLTPGVLLRLGDHSAVRMVSPGLTNTAVELTKGEALLEVGQLEQQNHLSVLYQGTTSDIEKKGLYRFSADSSVDQVYDGKLRVHENDQSVELGKGKQVSLAPGSPLKAEKFDRKQQDALYQWSTLRSRYLAEANAASVQTLIVNNGPGWYGSGWYWNPWFSTWAFVPGWGYWASPFGYSFYSPGYWYYNRPVYVVRPGYYHGGYRGIPRTGAVASPPAVRAPAPIGRVGGGGIRFGSAGRAMSGGRRF